MNINIRQAVKEDCKRMMELIQELATYERAANEVTVQYAHFLESGFGKNPVWWALVAEDTENNIIVGFALYYIRYSTWKGQRMFLEDLLVTESMRRKKIGRMLFEKLIEEARLKKFNAITWQVLDWNEPAIDFYKTLGNVKFDGEWINCTIET